MRPHRAAFQSRGVCLLCLLAWALSPSQAADAPAGEARSTLSDLLRTGVSGKPGTDETPLAILKTQDLSFGTLIPNAGGTVTIKAQNGHRKTKGAVVTLSLPGSTAAEFSVTGPKNGVYGVLFPQTAVLAREGGSETMTLSEFDLHPWNGSGFLGGEGRQILKMGATLTVGRRQPPGSYRGILTVTVVHE